MIKYFLNDKKTRVNSSHAHFKYLINGLKRQPKHY